MKLFQGCLLIILIVLTSFSVAQRNQRGSGINNIFKPCVAGINTHNLQNRNDLWPKIYNLPSLAGGKDIFECYDSGYMISGLLVDSDLINRMNIVIKTDVNGNPLWKRIIGDGTNPGSFSHFTPTLDGGCVLIGQTTVHDQCPDYFCYDIWIMKLDACGNKEWCKIYSVPMDIDEGADIIQLSNGNLIALVNYYGYDVVEERIALFCLSPDGETLWQKVYLTSEHPQWATYGYGYSLFKDKEENLLFTGECILFDDYINPTYWHYQMLNIKFSPDGEEIWGKPWYMEFDSLNRSGQYVAQDYHGNYVIGGSGPSTICQCFPPALLKLSRDGTILEETEFPQGMPLYYGSGGNHGGLAFTSANRIVTGTTYIDEPGYVPGHNVARLSDTLGNILQEKHLYDDPNVLMRVQQTSDNHILMTAGFWASPDSLKIFVYKLTPDLQFAQPDNRPLVYDYLCPQSPLPNDTIFPDCDIIVGVGEPMHQTNRYSLLVSPNPASEQLTITIPDRRMQEWESNGISSQTLYYKLPGNLRLQFTDALGRLSKTISIENGTKQITVDVSSWPAGIYLARLTGGDTFIAGAKLIVK